MRGKSGGFIIQKFRAPEIEKVWKSVPQNPEEHFERGKRIVEISVDFAAQM